MLEVQSHPQAHFDTVVKKLGKMYPFLGSNTDFEILGLFERLENQVKGNRPQACEPALCVAIVSKYCLLCRLFKFPKSQDDAKQAISLISNF
jgi:hypothetical protein